MKKFIVRTGITSVILTISAFIIYYTNSFSYNPKLSGNYIPFDFDTAEVVFYNYKTPTMTDIILPDGKINGAIQRITLNDNQIHLISDAILHTAELKFIRAECYMPHHGVLFYKNGHLIGVYEVCLSCNGERYAFPDGENDYHTNYDTLKSAFDQIGVYYSESHDDYNSFDVNNDVLTSHYTGDGHE